MTVLGLGSYASAWAIGVPGYETPTKPLDALGLVHLAQSMGLKLVQIADNLPLHPLSAAERKRLRDEAFACDVEIEVGTRGIQTAQLQQYIDIAAELGSPILRVVVDTSDHHPAPEEVIALVQAVLPALESTGVTLAIENHDRFRVRTLAGIIDTLAHPKVGICLDTVNSLGSAEGPEVVLQILGPYVVNLHVKDFVVRRADHTMGFQVDGAPAGQGQLDIPWVLDTLRSQDRSFNAILENWLPFHTSIAETMAKETVYTQEGIRYLRSLLEP
ncbi:MAG: sugar phosphate isomerase/epimerase [Anaerolineae bacterium]|nr:sugar phosphate isomerase/epimerase [Anaerolineae bacterium]